MLKRRYSRVTGLELNVLKIVRKVLRRYLPAPPKSVFLNQTLKLEIQEYGWSIGDFSYGKPTVFGRESAKLTVGKYTSIAEEVLIILDGHDISHTSMYPFAHINKEGFVHMDKNYLPHAKTRGDVSIGHDVYIGTRSIILSGVSIGNGAVIGAGSVVRESIPPYAVGFGNPCQVVRMRFDAEIIAGLMKVKYWDMPHHELRKIEELLRKSPETFLKSFQ